MAVAAQLLAGAGGGGTVAGDARALLLSTRQPLHPLQRSLKSGPGIDSSQIKSSQFLHFHAMQICLRYRNEVGNDCCIFFIEAAVCALVITKLDLNF